MTKDIVVSEELWKEIHQEKLNKGFKTAEDVIKNWRKNAKKKR